MGGFAGFRRNGSSGWAVLGALAGSALFGIAACAFDRPPKEGRFTHPEGGYSITWPGTDWEPTRIANTDLALRDPRGNTLALIRRCGIPLAEPAVMARHLRFGLEVAELRTEGPIDTPWGDPAWEQRFASRGAGRTIHVKAVTSTRAPCVFDWVLTTVGPAKSLESVFDGWWRSFEPGPRTASAAGSPRPPFARRAER